MSFAIYNPILILTVSTTEFDLSIDWLKFLVNITNIFKPHLRIRKSESSNQDLSNDGGDYTSVRDP